MAVQTLIQVRQGPATGAGSWGTVNPTLSVGEFGYDTTNNLLKIGNGGTVWSDLPALGANADQLTTGTVGVARGGTGSNTFTAGVLYSTGGTSALGTLSYSATPTAANNLVLTGTNGSITAGSGGFSTSGTVTGTISAGTSSVTAQTINVNQGSTPAINVKAASTSFSTTLQATSSLAAANTVNLPTGNGTLALTASPTFTGTVYLPTGTATAAPLDFNPGTLLSTPISGAVEYDGKAFYGTTAGTNVGAAARGYIPTEYFIISTSDLSFTASTSSQALFNNTNTNAPFSSSGAYLSLPVGTYFFECQLYMTTMSTSAGNLSFYLLNPGGANSTVTGTATIGSANIHSVGSDTSTPNTAQAQGGSFFAASSTGGLNAVTSGAGTSFYGTISGVFRVTAAGTIVPSFSTPNTGTSPVLKANSWFRVRLIGSETVSYVGPWGS